MKWLPQGIINAWELRKARPSHQPKMVIPKAMRRSWWYWLRWKVFGKQECPLCGKLMEFEVVPTSPGAGQPSRMPYPFIRCMGIHYVGGCRFRIPLRPKRWIL